MTVAQELRRKGHKVGIFTLGGPWAFKAKRFARVHTRRFTSTELRRVVAVDEYDVVHAHDSPSFRLIAQTALPKRTRVLLTIHGTYIPRAVIRRCIPKVSRFIVVSPALLGFTRDVGVPAAKVSLVENGVSMESFLGTSKNNRRHLFGIPKHAKVIGYAGRFTAGKALLGRHIVNVLKAYAKSQRNVRVLVAGRGSGRIVNHETFCRVLDHVDNMQAFYNSCDVVVGAGRVALESLACGTATIAVGINHYVGPVMPATWTRAVKGNFGDHGFTMHTWTNTRLQSDVHRLLHPTAKLQRDLQEVTRRVRLRYSSQAMARRVELLYRVR
ncbi:glycosyltransferase family 4 protein [Alicyclobacillus curvatus]|nr:glycosyltransferase family 4 protein [Alicyclobacillus curvatus]